MREEENELQHDHTSAAKAIDYTLYFESHHFDLMNEDDWDNYKISSQKIDSKQEYENNINSIEEQILQQERSALLNLDDDDGDNDDDDSDYDKMDDYYEENNNIEKTMKQALFHGHRLLEDEDYSDLYQDEQEEEYDQDAYEYEDEYAYDYDNDDEYEYDDEYYNEYYIDEEDEDYDSDYYDELYYNYYMEDDEGEAQILKEINACSKSIEALNNGRLCVQWHHENGLKLGMTSNANEAPNDMMMIDFNNDDHWNRIQMIDNLNKAAARGLLHREPYLFLLLYFSRKYSPFFSPRGQTFCLRFLFGYPCTHFYDRNIYKFHCGDLQITKQK